MMKRDHWGATLIRWCTCLVIVVGTICDTRQRVGQGAEPQRPNLILMMCDDLGWGDVGFNGGQTIRTPNLDAMAANALRFTRFYAAAPVCSPTRGSCLTGRHPYRYGIYSANRGHMKPEELTLAELLKRLGYTTGHFGKWHLGTMTKTIRDSNRGGLPGNEQHFSPPQANGFDVCFSTEAKVPTYDPMWKPRRTGNNSAWNALTDLSEAVPYGTAYWNEKGERVTDNLEGDDSKVIMDRVIPFVRAAVATQKPFFAVIWFHAPHLPVVADADHRALYPDAPSTLHQNYYGCVTAMDEQVGRLRAELRKLGIEQQTLFAFCSDNGPEGKDNAPGSTGGFRGRKRSLYEGGVRVPALIEWPGKVPMGQSTDFPAVTSDYLPTILEIVGAEMVDERPIDGISLVPVLENPSLRHREHPIGFQSGDQLAWTEDRFKLYRRGKQPWELYDLIADPTESNNIADQYPEVVERMRAELERWVTSCRRSDAGMDYR